jgi:hypothetical protein
MTLRSRKKHDNFLFKTPSVTNTIKQKTINRNTELFHDQNVEPEPEILSASSRKFLSKQPQTNEIPNKRSLSQNEIASATTTAPPLPVTMAKVPQQQKKPVLQRAQPVLLEFENSKFKLLGLNDNENESKSSIMQEVGIKVMTDEEMAIGANGINNNQSDGKKVGSLFHPSRIAMSSTPVHTNQSESK